MATPEGIKGLLAFLRENYPTMTITPATEAIYLVSLLPAPDSMIRDAAIRMIHEGERFPGPPAINERLRPAFERWRDARCEESKRLANGREDPPIPDLVQCRPARLPVSRPWSSIRR